MVISHLQPGQLLPSTTVNQLVDAANRIALIGIVPTSVAGTGVSVATNGQVSFSAATTVSLNGVFTSTYDNYRIAFNFPSRTVSTSISIRLRQLGVDVTSSNYDFVRNYATGTTNTVDSSSSSTGVPLDKTVSATQVTNGVLDLFGPALGSTPTTGNVQSMILSSSAGSVCQIGIINEGTTPSDGITFYLSGGTGTFNGTVRVYGYNNLI